MSSMCIYIFGNIRFIKKCSINTLYVYVITEYLFDRYYPAVLASFKAKKFVKIV